jgi:hypothetical protein
LRPGDFDAEEGSRRSNGSEKPVLRRYLYAARLFLVATLMTSLAKQLAVLLLRHALATLLDYGTHTHLLNSGFTDLNEIPRSFRTAENCLVTV